MTENREQRIENKGQRIEKMCRKVLALLIVNCLFLLTPCLVLAADFGLILDQNADYGGYGDSGQFTYSGILIPRVSAMLGDTSDIFVSVGLQAAYSDKWYFIPELLRTEFSYYSDMFGFTVGRMLYTDPLGFIAEGLFDGALFSYTNEVGTFSFGAWYTGLLYKRRVNIAMTADELKSYAAFLDFNDLANTYFAPRRFVAALGWEHLGRPLKTMVSVLGQFDLAGDNILHSQYLIGKVSVPGNVFSVGAGGAFSLLQYDGDLSSAFAAEIDIGWTPPTSFQSKVSLLGRYSSGVIGGGMFTAFEPLTIETQGEIMNAKLSGLSFVSLDYMTRLHRTFSVGLTSSYFIRTDKETYTSYPVLSGNSTEYFLGNEFFARLLWSPFSDIQVNLGGGMFLPSLGNVAPEAKSSWRVELNVIIALR